MVIGFFLSMSRVKRGITSHSKHKKLLVSTKGYRMTKNRLVRVAREAALHSGEYAFAGRRLKKRDMRQQWILRINQQLELMDLHYSRFINGLKKADIKLDRKILANLVVEDPEIFKAIVEKTKAQLN